MGVYHQMGHDSWNLVGEKPLHSYAGMILSPVNDGPTDVLQKLQQLKSKRPAGDFEIILDPQFYEPRTARGQLTHWPHFSEDVDTIDLSNQAWWEERAKVLASTASELGATAICTPAFRPKVYDSNYYRWTVDCANRAQAQATKAGLDVLLTAIVRLTDLTKNGEPQAIASVLTSTPISRIYLVLCDELPPRTQRTDVDALAGAVKLIKLLEQAGTRVLVAFSGLDMLLWKAAGATGVASGKFFNLRRFASGRFEEDGPEGGRVVPYWTDCKLITWLREDDVKLLDRKGLIDRAEAALNPYSNKILDILDSGSGKAWVGDGWRQYLYWFQATEAALSCNVSAITALLKQADSAWGAVNSSGVLLYDRQNTGEWIRPWLNAIHIGLENE